jgi:hypothetical protein
LQALFQRCCFAIHSCLSEETRGSRTQRGL